MVFLPLIKSCSSVTKTFEYEGCSVIYYEVVEQRKFLVGECLPCTGMHPCVSGFEPNARREILTCLCDGGKTEAAKSFTLEYMMGDNNTYKNNDGVNPGLKTIRFSQVTKDQIEDICNHIPREQIYM
jgi:hypothetical protein